MAEFEQICDQTAPEFMFEMAVEWYRLRNDAVMSAAREVRLAHQAMEKIAKNDPRLGVAGVQLEGMELRARFLQDKADSPEAMRVYLAERALDLAYHLAEDSAKTEAAEAIVRANGMCGPAWVLTQVAYLEQEGREVPPKYAEVVQAYLQLAQDHVDSRHPMRATDQRRLLLEGRVASAVSG